MSEHRLQTVSWAPAVWGEDGVCADDAAEAFHEASRLYPRTGVGSPGLAALSRDPSLRASLPRATKRHGRGGIALPPSPPSELTWDDVVLRRKSEREFARRPAPLDRTAAILRDAYGVTHELDGLPLRTVPSGGGLFPLEIYVVARAVDGVPAGVYHFDPLRETIEAVTGCTPAELGEASPYGEMLESAAFTLVVTAVFWRTRFKYGLRGYRFALVEAGHLAQNVLLAAVARGLAAVPIGGFYDRRLDAVVGADGLDEASVYAIAVGWPA